MFFLDMCVKNFNKNVPLSPFNTASHFKVHFNGPHTKTHFPKHSFLGITGVVDKTDVRLDGVGVYKQVSSYGGVVEFLEPRYTLLGVSPVTATIPQWAYSLLVQQAGQTWWNPPLHVLKNRGNEQ